MTDDPYAKSEQEAALEAELEAMRDRPLTPEPSSEDAHADYHDRLNSIEQRAQAAKSQAKAKSDFAYREERGRVRYEETGKGLSTGMAAAAAIIGGPMVGYGIGYLIDLAAGTEAWRAMIMLLGAVIGLAFTVRYVNQQNEK